MTTAISLSANNGFIGSVQLDCPQSPATLTCVFVPSSLHLVKGVVATSQLTIAASQSNAALPVLPRAIFGWAMMPILGGVFLSGWGCRKIHRSDGTKADSEDVHDHCHSDFLERNFSFDTDTSQRAAIATRSETIVTYAPDATPLSGVLPSGAE